MKNNLLESFKKKRLEALVIIAGLCLTVFLTFSYIREMNSKMEFSSDSLIFAAIGDPHYGWGDQYADEIVKAWMNDPNLPAAEFGINIGDFTHFGSPEGYSYAMRKSFNNVLFPWMFLTGNHDTANYKTDTGVDIYGDGWGVPDKETYDKPYSAIEAAKNVTGTMQRNYAYLWDNILFLFFGDKGTTMLLTREQRQWLKFMTAQYPDKTTITVSHQGLKREEENNCYRYYNDQEWWQSFLNNNSQIALHIHGHNHMFKHYQYYGLDCIDVGITNSQGGKPWTVYFEITEKSIRAGIYDVLTQNWVNNKFFEKELDTGFKNEGIKWYSVSKRVQDNEQVSMDNRIVAKNHSLQVIGSDPELIEQNRKFSHWGEKDYDDALLYWIGYQDDNNNGNTEGEVEFTGKDTFATSITPILENQVPIGWWVKWEEGKVPDSTTPLAIPGESYRIRIKAKATEEIADAMDVSVRTLGKNLSNVISEQKVMNDVDLTPSYQWFEGSFSVPDNEDAWIMQTLWETKKEDATCFLDEWSITRDYKSPQIDNFSIGINDHELNSTQPLGYNEYKTFTLPNTVMKNKINILPQINGSKTALLRLIYENPLIWSDDLSFGTNYFSESECEIEFNLVSPAAPDDFISVSVFNPNGIAIRDISKTDLKRDSYAWTVKKEDIPKKYTIEL